MDHHDHIRTLLQTALQHEERIAALTEALAITRAMLSAQNEKMNIVMGTYMTLVQNRARSGVN